MNRRMLRHWVLVNDRPQDLHVGDPVHVAAAQLGVGPNAQHIVEFWAEGTLDDLDLPERTFQVFGTGQPLPHNAVWIGTTDRTSEGLVWHLYELLVGLA